MSEPEELPLSDLMDDDFEYEGATRVLPKSPHFSYPPVAMSAPPPPMKTSNAPIWAALVGVVAVFGIAVLGVGAFLLRAHLRHAAEDADTTTATTAPADTTTTADTATAAPVPTETQLEPLALAAPSATVHAHAAPRGNGMLQTFAVGRGKTILVDGKSVGVGGSRVKVACGRHSIAVGSGKARSYEVPCNGSTITVGTPDGT